MADDRQTLIEQVKSYLEYQDTHKTEDWSNKFQNFYDWVKTLKERGETLHPKLAEFWQSALEETGAGSVEINVTKKPIKIEKMSPERKAVLETTAVMHFELAIAPIEYSLSNIESSDKTFNNPKEIFHSDLERLHYFDIHLKARQAPHGLSDADEKFSQTEADQMREWATRHGLTLAMHNVKGSRDSFTLSDARGNVIATRNVTFENDGIKF